MTAEADAASPTGWRPVARRRRLEASRGWAALELRELWEYRELLYFLIWRDVKIRYRQTILGLGWAVLPPVLTMVVFSIFFGRLAGIPSEGVPYPLFAFAALIPWTLFSNGLTQAANSLVGSANLITKVYFPRLLIPIAAVLAGLVDFAVALGVLAVMMAAYGVAPGPEAVWLPLLVLLALATALGIGFWLSSLNARYRDVRFVVPFLAQFWLFATPIAYPSTLLDEPWRTLFGLNPMAGVVEGFRWALLDTDTRPGGMILVSSAVALAVLVGGLFFFRRTERRFVDVI